jgi:hypothetical protein
MVRRYNGELVYEAMVKAILGAVFSLFTFGFMFWIGWFFSWGVATSLSLEPWQCGALLAGVFFVVAAWSAWRQVDPMAGLERMTDRQWLLTQISLASPHLLYFSPRHALAGSAVVLLGGPSSMFQAIGIWAHRLRADQSLIEDAALLLTECSEPYPVEEARSVTAALLLRRLSLITVVACGHSAAFTLTEKGSKVLSKPGVKKRKRQDKK